METAQLLQEIRSLHPAPGGDIRQVMAGGFLELENSTYKVMERYRYLEVKWGNFNKKKSEYWVTEFKLLNVLTGETVYLEWEDDDQLEIYLTTKVIRLKDISYHGSAVKTADLVEMADEEEGTVVVNGTSYHYSEDDTWAALFYRENDTEGEPVRFYEFSSDSNESLTIEAWEDEDSRPEREAFTSREISYKQIKILQVAGGSEGDNA